MRALTFRVLHHYSNLWVVEIHLETSLHTHLGIPDRTFWVGEPCCTCSYAMLLERSTLGDALFVLDAYLELALTLGGCFHCSTPP